MSKRRISKFAFAISADALEQGFYCHVENKDGDDATIYANSIGISGWAIHPNTAVEEILVEWDSNIVAHIPVLLERPDVVPSIASKTSKCGFMHRMSMVDMPAEFTVTLYARIESNGSSGEGARFLFDHIKLGELSVVRGRRFARPTKSKFSPILVSAVPRSGTTLLMGLLSLHPEIVVPGGPPYEYRLATYLWNASRIISGPAGVGDVLQSASFEVEQYGKVGFNLFASRFASKSNAPQTVIDWIDRGLTADAGKFAVRAIDKYVSLVCDTQGKQAAALFAEKMPIGSLLDYVHNVYARAYEIFLVRDFRDVFASARAFNEKRGEVAFGRQQFKSDLDWLAALGKSYENLLNVWERRSRKAILVRYEALIENPSLELARVCAYIGVQSDPSFIDNLVRSLASSHTERSSHSTSSSPSASIGRWRRDLTDEEQVFVGREQAHIIRRLGYSID